VLVLTGEARIEQVSALLLKPYIIIDDIGQLGEMLVCARSAAQR